MKHEIRSLRMQINLFISKTKDIIKLANGGESEESKEEILNETENKNMIYSEENEKYIDSHNYNDFIFNPHLIEVKKY